ncbi:MAG: EFR1 family ferrodoxin [Deltaproteobacteria bacterium]|nr:EFR1 family ferrodoxin [Deltaproteobacteria bacterium]
MSYKNVTVYYASGTGNSYRAASWLTDVFDAENTRTHLVPVDKAVPAQQQQQTGSQQLVGLYHPAHGLMPPWSMIHFLLFRLQRGKGAHGAVVATRGGIPLGNIIIPGGGGLALYFPLLILLIKGYRIRGAMGLDMPCNLLNVHWGITPENTERMFERAKRHHDRFSAALLANGPAFRTANLLWELLWCVPFAFYPLLPFIYLTISRVFMAKLMFADATCTHCGACARHCPRDAIKMVGSPKTQTPFWTWRCEACMRCMGYCRHKSIQAAQLWGVAVWWGLSFLSAVILQHLYVNSGVASSQWVAPHTTYLSWALAFFGLLPAYYLFYGLQKIPPLRWLFTYTTLTRLYRRRYHAPDTRVKDVANGQM